MKYFKVPETSLYLDISQIEGYELKESSVTILLKSGNSRDINVNPDTFNMLINGILSVQAPKEPTQQIVQAIEAQPKIRT